MTTLSGGKPVYYRCDESNGWQPDVADLESKITDRTKALLVINPNNPTGAVYSREVLAQIADVARRHSLLLLADEIYDKILYDDAEHVSIASARPDLLCLTFNGLSKAYRVCGYRAGWVVITGPKDHAQGFIEGLRPVLDATVLQRSRPARDPGGTRRLPVDRCAVPAGRAALRAAQRDVGEAQ